MDPDNDILERFSDAWNAHDINELMACMTNDCVYYAASGTPPFGSVYRGTEAVRASFVAIWQHYPDAQWLNARHMREGNYGLSEWLFRGTPNGASEAVEVSGVDLFQLRANCISIKNTFRKQPS